MLQFNPQILILLLVGLILLIASVLLWRRSHDLITRLVPTIFVAQGIFMLAYVMELSSTTVTQQIFWIQLQESLTPIIAIVLSAFVLLYIRQQELLNNRMLQVIVISLAVAQWLLVWTISLHKLYFTSFETVVHDNLAYLAPTYGVGFWIMNLLFAALLLTVIGYATYTVTRTPDVYHRQTSYLLISSVILLTSGIISLAHEFSDSSYLLNPAFFGLTLATLPMVWGVYQETIFRLIPVAQETIIDTMREGIIVIDDQRRIIQANKLALSMASKTITTLRGQPIDEVFPQIASHINDKSLDKEISLENTDYHLRYNPLRNPKGKLIGYIVSLQDITHINRMNQQLLRLEEEQEKLLVIRNLISHTAHDFRTPLSVIKLNAFGIERKGDDPIKRQEYTDSIDEQVDRIDMLMKAIQTIADLDVGPIVSTNRSVNVNKMMQELFEEANERANEKQITVSFDPVSIRTHLLGDIDRLKQAVRNVIDNAIKFTPKGGTIQIKSERVDHTVRIDIIDTGMGICDQDLPNIFDRFYKPINPTGHENGLGLAICKLIVEGHGGTISVKSEVDKGSNFTITLPCLPISSKTTQELQPLNL